MLAANMANTYKNQQILTAPPEELTLMLYNGAIRFINDSIKGINEKDIGRSHNSNMRAQAIINELMLTLDMKIEISKSLLSLYDYINFRLVQGNMKKDKEQLDEACSLVKELRDTWIEAMKRARIERGPVANDGY